MADSFRSRVFYRILAGMFFLGPLGFALTACVPHQIYNETRSQYLQTILSSEDGAIEAHMTVIEFDDHGVLWKRDQLEDTVSLIREANRTATDGVMVIVYMHGWKNNADSSNPKGALAQFRENVENTATRAPGGRPFAADRVVGVFLGWRGDTSDIPFQEQLTFWDRHRAGERVASVHMQEALLRIMNATKERRGSKCFIVGHSMGGMIVGKTVFPILTTHLLSQDDDGARLPVDLVLLQNPALDALASWQTIDLMKRFGAELQLRSTSGTVERARGPLIAAITSKADTATGRAYPFGRTIANLGTTFRHDNAPGHPTQRYLATHTIGHVGPLTSHRAWVEEGEVVIQRIPDSFNDTPFWVIEVSKDISKDHGDVNNALYGQMIEKLLAMNDVYRTDVESWIVTEQGAR